MKIQKDNDLYRIFSFIYTHRSFYIRAALFLLLLFVVLPLLIDGLSALLLPQQAFHFTIDRTAPFFLIILILTYMKYEKQFLSFSFKNEWTGQHRTEKLLYLVLLIGSIALLLTIKHLFWWQFVQQNIHTLIYMTASLQLIISFLAFLIIFGQRFFNLFSKPILSVVFILILFFSISYILTVTWKFFSGIVTQMVSSLLHLTFTQISYEMAQVPTLELYSFKVFIGDACSGIDSLSLFFSIYVLIMMYDYARIRMKRALAFFPVGLIGMFAMTVLRIYILMVVGKYNPELSVGLFHDNLGWIFFVVYILIFWYFAYGYIVDTKSKKESGNKEKYQPLNN